MSYRFELSTDGYLEAEKEFNKIKFDYEYVRLVQSLHYYSEGYWIEFNTHYLNGNYDTVIREQDNAYEFRRKKLEKLLNE